MRKSPLASLGSTFLVNRGRPSLRTRIVTVLSGPGSSRLPVTTVLASTFLVFGPLTWTVIGGGGAALAAAGSATRTPPARQSSVIDVHPRRAKTAGLLRTGRTFATSASPSTGR